MTPFRRDWGVSPPNSIGPNAAGKSTLLRRIAGVLKGSGTVRVGGAHRGICYMPQDTGANAVLTVFESILLAARGGRGAWRVTDAELGHIDRVLDLLNIAPLASRNLGALSGGQRQLVSLAQVLVRRPDVLLMDEPTSALNLHRQVEVLELVRDLAADTGMVAIVALHDLPGAALCGPDAGAGGRAAARRGPHARGRDLGDAGPHLRRPRPDRALPPRLPAADRGPPPA